MFQLAHDNNFEDEKVVFGSFFLTHQLPQNKYSWTASQVMRPHFYQLMKLRIKINVLSSYCYYAVSYIGFQNLAILENELLGHIN